jgi:hypothetical protein
MPKTVNAQIVDAVTTTNTATVGESSSLAMGMFFQAESQAFALGLQNAVVSQRGSHQIGEALTATACALMLAAVAAPAAK